jgi:hypothetical protein
MCCGFAHLRTPRFNLLAGIALHEGNQSIRLLPVFLSSDAANARRGTPADIAEQTGPANALRLIELPARTGTHRERREQFV